MKHVSFTLLFTFFGSVVLSKPYHVERRALPSQVCQSVNAVVSVLQLNKATPFCSSFLNITPVTQTQTTTASQTVTVTAEVDQTISPVVVMTVPSTTTTSPIVVVTQTLSFTSTSTTFTSTSTITALTTSVAGTTTATVPTTSTITSTITTTLSPTPPTTTIYTVAPARRSLEQIEERQVNVPLFLRGVASSALSQACSCLGLTTSTTGVTVAVTNSATTTTTITSVFTSPITSPTTEVATITSPVTATTTTSETSITVLSLITTITVTATVPTTAITTTTAATTTTVTLTRTITGAQTTVTLPYPNQVVVNPSFETGTGGGGAPPWTGIFVNSGAAFSFLITECDSTLCAYDGSRFVDFVADSPGGTTSISQTLHGVQPGYPYTFTCYVGFYNGGVPSNPTSSFITITLGGVTIVPEQQTCTTDSACSLKGNQYYGWRRITVANIITSNPDPVLTISERLVVGTQTQIQDSLFDQVTLARQ